MEVKESSVLSGPNYLELSSLSMNRRYDVWVKAATGVGYGPSSVITSIILGRIGKSFRHSFPAYITKCRGSDPYVEVETRIYESVLNLGGHFSWNSQCSDPGAIAGIILPLYIRP